MILFLEDYQKYPTAILDTKTTNQSFVRLASLYRKMGIKNHAFILTLINPSLQGVDPFDYDNLTIEQKADIAIECKINPWYFFREVVRVPTTSSGDAIPLEANRGNIALFWSFFNHIMIILLQPRQTGKSVSTDVLMTLLMNIICKNTKINLLTKNDDLRGKNTDRIKAIIAELPFYLNQRTSRDSNNREAIDISRLNNSYTAHVPQMSAKAAMNMGRGLTSPIFHVDEAPFQANIEIALKAALPATGRAMDDAEVAGDPYGVILTTTAGKKDDRDGEYVYRLITESADWSDHFLDCINRQDLENTVRRNSRGGKLRIHAEFDHKQLGKTDEWLAKKIEEALSEGLDADRDYFNRWTSGSMTSPLGKTALEQLRAGVRAPDLSHISAPYGYITRWYIPEHLIDDTMQTGKFILGMDTSDGGGGDDISLYIQNIETLATVAVGTYNETNLITLSEWVASILVQYENITAIIENRSSAAAIIDHIIIILDAKGIDPFKRLFNWVVNDRDEYPERFKEINVPLGRRSPEVYTRYKKMFGFATSGTGETSRTALYSYTLQNAAKRGATVVQDKAMVDQISGLVSKNGRIDHAAGKHDDLVIAWLLTNWFLTSGKNLDYYGIDYRRVMCAVRTLAKPGEEYSELQLEQQRIRGRIEEIYKQLTNEADEYISLRLEDELRLLDKKLILESGEIYSLEELLKNSRQIKQQRKRETSLSYSGYQNQPNYQVDGRRSDRPLGVKDFY